MEEGLAKIQEQATKLDDKKLLKVIRFYWRFSQPIFSAPLLWAIYGEPTETFELPPKIETLMELKKGRKSNVDLSLGCSLQNLSLKAVELGLGSCIYTAPQKFLSASTIDAKKIPVAFITFGKPDQKPKQPPQKESEEIFSEI